MIIRPNLNFRKSVRVLLKLTHMGVRGYLFGGAISHYSDDRGYGGEGVSLWWGDKPL